METHYASFGQKPLSLESFGVRSENGSPRTPALSLRSGALRIHLSHEKRYYALGQSDAERRLFLAYTLCHKRIRVISARDVTQKESNVYQRHEKNNT